jgi:arginase family enzyme
MDSNKIDPKRIAFVGMRSKIMEAGSSLGGSLPMFFKNLLQLDNQIFTAQDVHTKGVEEVFGECIKVFRDAFPQQHLEVKDAEVREASGDDEAEWVPPFMVSWDADSIDPNDFPCTIAQEVDGLTSEECLAFSDQIASPEKMVMMEIIEFNPDLWKGYLDEPIQLTMNDFIAGAYANHLRTPNNVSGQRLDLQKSVKLLQDMIVRASKTSKDNVES